MPQPSCGTGLKPLTFLFESSNPSESKPASASTRETKCFPNTPLPTKSSLLHFQGAATGSWSNRSAETNPWSTSATPRSFGSSSEAGTFHSSSIEPFGASSSTSTAFGSSISSSPMTPSASKSISSPLPREAKFVWKKAPIPFSVSSPIPPLPQLDSYWKPTPPTSKKSPLFIPLVFSRSKHTTGLSSCPGFSAFTNLDNASPFFVPASTPKKGVFSSFSSLPNPHSDPISLKTELKTRLETKAETVPEGAPKRAPETEIAPETEPESEIATAPELVSEPEVTEWKRKPLSYTHESIEKHKGPARTASHPDRVLKAILHAAMKTGLPSNPMAAVESATKVIRLKWVTFVLPVSATTKRHLVALTPTQLCRQNCKGDYRRALKSFGIHSYLREINVFA
jgi:hypothetical protein